MANSNSFFESMTVQIIMLSFVTFVTIRKNRSGAGGSRTLVRTRKPYAFYTLILAFVFVL